ncbi:uncharacterized protein FTJAE_1033 [Fusarium tjaetaba]|uniref:Uncharacterized protein n=1 Tax=Fusarium tjaetaba TaxID=1567544 RepID=A0A8H5W718_9HYPO|nr:uncharacterized protein FTJAE_1033 [Fusarium tjaetaba]KAF5649291.1 hypothetical protein FTJAE_1033 [Fusarium tjaetaba]
MSPQDNAAANTMDTTGPRRRSSATMGNVANEPVDRSAQTAVSRKQKRANRRSTLRMQSEVAPFLGMYLHNEEDEAKERNKADDKKEEEKEKGEKNDEENEQKDGEEDEAEKEK